MVTYCFLMYFDRLRVLTAVARTGSVRAAAAALHVTPGAVSKAIGRLEQETGVQILVPEGHGIRLSEKGAWLARRAQHLVGEHASLAHDLATRRFRSSELCIATYDAFAASVPAVLAAWFLPDVPLSLRGCAARCRGVPADDLPFAVPSHPLTGVVSTYGPLDGWPADGPPREVRYRASSLEGRLELCRAGLAALLLPRFVAARHDARTPARLRLERRDPPADLVLPARRVHLARRATTSVDDPRVAAVRAAISVMCAPV